MSSSYPILMSLAVSSVALMTSRGRLYSRYARSSSNNMLHCSISSSLCFSKDSSLGNSRRGGVVDDGVYLACRSMSCCRVWARYFRRHLSMSVGVQCMCMHTTLYAQVMLLFPPPPSLPLLPIALSLPFTHSLSLSLSLSFSASLPPS